MLTLTDFGRFSKNHLSGYNQFFALPIIGTLGALTPIFVTSAHSYIWGDFQWYMPLVIADFDSRAAKFFVSFSFMLATIGNQVAAGSYPFANDVTGLAPKYINIFRGTVFMCIFCVICTPWNIIKNAAGLLAFLSGYSCLMGPLAGIIVTDFYIIKKRKLNIHEMYTGGGIYHYYHGFNLRAWGCFIIGVAPLMPGFAKAIANDLNVGGSWKLYAFAWIYGFVTSSVSYYIVNMYIWPQHESLVPEAIYPPHVGDPVSPMEVSSVEEEYKVPIAHEKETDSPV
jgi:NCS1 family nucleobase:cation symporter-1